MKGHGSSVESHFVFPGGISPHFLRNHKLDVNFCEMPIIILNCETIQLYREREREKERDYNDSVYLNGSLVITSVLQDLANKEITEIEPI